MDVHSTRNHGVWDVRVHHVENAVDDLVTFHAQDGSSQDAFRLCVHQDLHEALRLAFLHGASHPTHGTGGHERGTAALAHLGFRHADPAQRRIDVDVVGGDAVADAASVPIQQVGGDNLKVVVRSVG